ncbi:hypothetical protein NKH77_40750 [Streptomyces sp. M19]
MATTEFGRALRQGRDRVAPETAGLPGGGRRRAAAAPRGAGATGRDLRRLRHPPRTGPGHPPSVQVVEALSARCGSPTAGAPTSSSWPDCYHRDPR